MTGVEAAAMGLGMGRVSASGGYSKYAPPSRTYAPAGKLPILVGILAILIAIIGFFVLLGGIILLLYGLNVYDGLPRLISTSGYISDPVIFGALYFVLGAIMVADARGLWDQESWALWLTGSIVFIELIGALLDDAVLLSLVLVLLLVYLVAVRHHFD